MNLKKGIPYAILLLIFLVLPVFLHTSYWIGVLIMVLYKVVGSVSLRTISLSGTLTFAHGAFIAIGAYCGGILAKTLGLPPVVTMFCQYLGYLIAGGAVVENVFSLSGLGTYLVGCVAAADSTAVATCAVIVAAVFVAANLLGDLANRLLCPWTAREDNHG